MTKNKCLIVLFLLLACVGIPMLMIGPPHSLDVRLYYSHAEAMQWFDSLIYDEKTNYLINECLDLIYIAVYTGIFLILNGKWGVIPGIIDLMETIPIILFLKNGNELPEYLGIISMAKWIAGVVFIVLSVKKLLTLRNASYSLR